MDCRRLAFVFALCAYLGIANAQERPGENLTKRIAEVESELQPTMGHVRLHRVEELEDLIFTPKAGVTDIEPPVYLYQVENRTFYLERGEVVRQTGAGKYSSYIGISRDGERVYRLGGFSEEEKDFARLVSDQHLSIPATTRAAESRAMFCAETVFAINPDWWIIDESNVKMGLAHHFFNVGDDDAFGSAEQWWRKYRTSHPTFKAGASVTEKTPRTFIVSLPFLWAPVEGETAAQIRELNIEVHEDGSCHRQ